MCELVEECKEIGSKTKHHGVYLAWIIWCERNKKIFENKMMPNVVLIERVYRMVDE